MKKSVLNCLYRTKCTQARISLKNRTDREMHIINIYQQLTHTFRLENLAILPKDQLKHWCHYDVKWFPRWLNDFFLILDCFTTGKLLLTTNLASSCELLMVGFEGQTSWSFNSSDQPAFGLQTEQPSSGLQGQTLGFPKKCNWSKRDVFSQFHSIMQFFNKDDDEREEGTKQTEVSKKKTWVRPEVDLELTDYVRIFKG